ncbi:hypothetical protein GA0115251_106512 [Streptomyces sp. TverLS-915]|nr:hypothetical protein GA0115251_106512 [Streptomyces sp. TverLS-915]
MGGAFAQARGEDGVRAFDRLSADAEAARAGAERLGVAPTRVELRAGEPSRRGTPELREDKRERRIVGIAPAHESAAAPLSRRARRPDASRSHVPAPPAAQAVRSGLVWSFVASGASVTSRKT